MARHDVGEDTWLVVESYYDDGYNETYIELACLDSGGGHTRTIFELTTIQARALGVALSKTLKDATGHGI